LVKLRPLKVGSRIGIAAPAGPFDRKRFLKGVRVLNRLGFRVQYGQDIFARNGYLAGNDRRRARELIRFLQNRRVQALLFARGGYGCAPLLPLLLKNSIKPKVVVGFSDLTVILNFLWKGLRLPSLYGPMVATDLGGVTHPKNAERLHSALIDPDFFEGQHLVAKSLLNPGQARGRLVGGCLQLIISTLGTPYDLETRGSILFLEDTGEEAYRVDRMITQLIQAGKLRGVRGIVLGTFKIGKQLFPTGIHRVFQDRLKWFRGPILWGVRFGHCENPLILPLGGIGRIEGRRLLIEKGIF